MTDTSNGATHRPVLWRIALFLFVVSSILWLGGVNIRAMIGNDMLKFGTLEFEDYLSPEAEREIYRLLALTSVAVIGSYLTALISSIVFLVSSPFKLRENGWLLMSAILFYIFVPVEFFTMWIDGRMIYQEFYTTADNQIFRELFVARVGALRGTPLIALMCYYTIIGLAVFRPMTRKPQADA